MSSRDRFDRERAGASIRQDLNGLPDGALSRYAALRHEVARAAAILPRKELPTRCRCSRSCLRAAMFQTRSAASTLQHRLARGHGSALAAAGHAAGARDALYSDLSSSVVEGRTARTAGARQAATATPRTTTAAAEASTVQSCGTTS